MTPLSVRPTIHSCVNQDGATLLDVEQGIVVTLNPVGGRIWQLLSQGETADRACQIIAAEYQVREEMVAKDVTEFIDQLAKQRLL